MLSSRLFIYFLIGVSISSLPRAMSGVVLSEYEAAIERHDPMDLEGVERGLANVLRNYYKSTFTDAETWEQIESVRFDGVLELAQGTFSFTAFKKKPNYCKVVVHLGGGAEYILAYDGEDAWQLNTAETDAQPVDMPSDEARNFIRDAALGGHLLYPKIQGKTIELLGTKTVDEERYYELKVTLPDGQVIRSLLDMVTFREVHQIVMNYVSGDEEHNKHSDFTVLEGFLLPKETVLVIAEQKAHRSRLRSIKSNTGVMPWSFNRPAMNDDGVRKFEATELDGTSASSSGVVSD